MCRRRSHGGRPGRLAARASPRRGPRPIRRSRRRSRAGPKSLRPAGRSRPWKRSQCSSISLFLALQAGAASGGWRPGRSPIVAPMRRGRHGGGPGPPSRFRQPAIRRPPGKGCGSAARPPNRRLRATTSGRTSLPPAHLRPTSETRARRETRATPPAESGRSAAPAGLADRRGEKRGGTRNAPAESAPQPVKGKTPAPRKERQQAALLGRDPPRQQRSRGRVLPRVVIESSASGGDSGRSPARAALTQGGVTQVHAQVGVLNALQPPLLILADQPREQHLGGGTRPAGCCRTRGGAATRYAAAACSSNSARDAGSPQTKRPATRGTARRRPDQR